MSVREGAVMVWGAERPAVSVGWCEPMWPDDSGFTVVFADAPDPDEVAGYENPADHPGIGVVHLACLLDEFPEVGAGLDIARAHLVADLDDEGRWVVGDVSRLDDEGEGG